MFGEGIAGAMIGAVTNIAGQAMQNDYNEKQAEINRQWEEGMMDKQNAWNLDMWNRNNEYNSPIEQVKRMREAGINPTSASLTPIGASAPDSASTNGVGTPTMTQNPLGGLSEQLSSMWLKKKQADVLESEANKNDAQAEKFRSDSKDSEAFRSYKVKLLGQDFELRSAKDKREAERHSADMDLAQQTLVNMAEENKREWLHLDIQAQRLRLEQDAESFKQSFSLAELDMEAKRLAVAMYNAGTARLAAESDAKLNEATIYKLNVEGQLVAEKTKLTAKEVEYFDEEFKQKMKNQRVSNVTSCINCLTSGTRDVMIGVAAVMSGGKGLSITESRDTHKEVAHYGAGGEFNGVDVTDESSSYTKSPRSHVNP